MLYKITPFWRILQRIIPQIIWPSFQRIRKLVSFEEFFKEFFEEFFKELLPVQTITNCSTKLSLFNDFTNYSNNYWTYISSYAWINQGTFESDPLKLYASEGRIRKRNANPSSIRLSFAYRETMVYLDNLFPQ